MDWGSLSSWAGFALTVVILLVGQIINGRVQRTRMETFFNGKMEMHQEHLERLDREVSENRKCLASIKKRSTDFLTIPSFKDHVADCKAIRRDENLKKESEIASLRNDIGSIKSEIQGIGGMVKQLLALQTGKVQ